MATLIDGKKVSASIRDEGKVVAEKEAIVAEAKRLKDKAMAVVQERMK